MDFLSKSFSQLRDLFQSMTPGSRITAALLLAAVVISLGYLVTHEMPGSGTYLMGGESFAPRDLHAMEAALGEAQLSYEIEGGKILVPRGQQFEYMAALAKADALPQNFGDILQRAMDTGSVWEDKQRSKERLKLATQKALGLTISAMTGIDTAVVFYDERSTGGLHNQTVQTASVSVRPLGSQTLDESLVPSIRSTVAAAFAGLKPEDVVVTDLNGRRSFRGGSDGLASPMDDPYLVRKQFHEKHYKDVIGEALAYVPGVIVTCNVELGPEQVHREEAVKHDPKTVPYQVTDNTTTKSQQGSSPGGVPGYRSQSVTNAAASLTTAQASGSSEEEQATERQEINALSSTRTETTLTAHPLRKVTVAVAVPESHFRKVWQERNPPQLAATGTAAGEPKTPTPAELEQIRTEEEARIRSLVAALLPTPADATDSAGLVTVTPFSDFKPEPLPEPGFGPNALTWLAESWRTLGLIGLGLVSLVMLRSMVRSAPAAASPRPAASQSEPEVEPERGPERADLPRDVQRPEPGSRRRFNTSGGSLKNELSDMVQTDPDTAANILRNWIGNAT